MSRNMQQIFEHIFDCLYVGYGININELRRDYYIIFNVQICTILRFHLGN